MTKKDAKEFEKVVLQLGFVPEHVVVKDAKKVNPEYTEEGIKKHIKKLVEKKVLVYVGVCDKKFYAQGSEYKLYSEPMNGYA